MLTQNKIYKAGIGLSLAAAFTAATLDFTSESRMTRAVAAANIPLETRQQQCGMVGGQCSTSREDYDSCLASKADTIKSTIASTMAHRDREKTALRAFLVIGLLYAGFLYGLMRINAQTAPRQQTAQGRDDNPPRP